MFLADACALLAFFGIGETTLSEAGLAAMQGDVLVSSITLWKLTRKAAIGKLPPLPTDWGSFARYLTSLGFRHARLIWADAEAANALASHHRDPMNRMLIATALRCDLTVITSDRIFGADGARTVW